MLPKSLIFVRERGNSQVDSHTFYIPLFRTYALTCTFNIAYFKGPQMILLAPGANLTFYMEVPLESEIPGLDPLLLTSSLGGF